MSGAAALLATLALAGKRGLIRKGGARVVLPGVQEADPRGPEEP